MEVTYIFHISTWIFFYVLKNSINRTDILLLIFHISTCRSSCHLYTCEGDLRVTSTFLHGIFPIQWKISNRRMLSVHSTSPHGIFSVCKKNPPGGWTSWYGFFTFPHPIYQVTSIQEELTDILHISTWIFFLYVKKFHQ